MSSRRFARGSAPDVSVALCTFNGAAYLAAQLESIANQTLLPKEIVISDDGSTDETLEVVARVLPAQRLVESGITLTLLGRSTPLGVTKNFEAAISACSGEFIALCDQDDIWSPDKLARLRQAIDVPGVLLVHSDARMVDALGRPLRHALFETLGARTTELRREQGPRALEVLLRRNLVTGATAMVRRSLVSAAQPFPESWVHDHWLAIVAALTGRIVLVPDKLVDYRQHGANQIGATKLTAGGAIDLLGQSRRQRHEARVERIAELNRRIMNGDLPASAEQRAFVTAKLTHERVRLKMPKGRAARWPSVARELVTGRYHRLSRGFIDVVRDALSPS